MAAALRPSTIRQVCRDGVIRRTLTVKASAMPLSLICNSSRISSINAQRLSTRPSIGRDQLPSSITCAAFHTSASRAILPPLPQRIDGTANDPAPVPAAAPTHGSYHWTFERLIAASLIPLTIAPFAAGSLNPIMDATLCAAILIHSHIGFESIIIDYIPRKRLPKTRTSFWWGLRLATLSVGVGLYEFETNDVGLTEAIKKIWTA